MKLLRKCVRWLTKVSQYARLLWDDEDWDYHFVLKLLQYKLSRTRKCIVKNRLITDANRVGREIWIAEKLIQRILDNEYTDYYEELITRTFGELVLKDGHLTCAKITDTLMEAEYHEALRHMVAHEEYLLKQDYAYLLKHIQRHIRGWWD